MHDLLSRTFLESLEAWQDLDAAATTSSAVQNLRVEADLDEPAIFNDPYAETLVIDEQAAAVEARPAAVDPVGNPGTDEPEAAAVETSPSPIGNQQGTDEPEAAAVETSPSPIGNQQGTDEPEAAALETSPSPIGNQQGTDEPEAAAVETPSVPIGNQVTDEQGAAAVETPSVPAAVEASSVPIGNQGAQAAAVEAPSVPVGNQGTDEQEWPAVEAPSVPLGNQGTDEPEVAAVGNQGTDEQGPAAVEAPTVRIGNQGTDEQGGAAVEAPSRSVSAELQSTQLDPEAALSGTPKKHVSPEAVALCRVATPQKERGLLPAALVQCKEDVAVIDSDGEADCLLDEMLKTQFQAYMKREDGDGSREIMKHEPWLPSNGDDMSGMLEVVTTDAYMEPEEEPSASSTAASYAPQQLVVASADSAHAPSDAPPK
ncbi:CLE-4A-2, partial [Symbiodinium microadriaticum]